MRPAPLFFVFATTALAEPVFSQQLSRTAPNNFRLYATINERGGVSHSFFAQETGRSDGKVSGQITVRTRLPDGRTHDALLLFAANCRYQPDAPPQILYSRPNSNDLEAVVILDPKTLQSPDDVQEPLKLWLAVCYESELSPQIRAPEQKPPNNFYANVTPGNGPPSPKLAALPAVNNVKAFNGTWAITWSRTTGCKIPSGTYTISIANRVVTGNQKSGSVTNSGTVSWRTIDRFGKPVAYRGKLHNNSGSGSFQNLSNHCGGTFTARKNDKP